VGTHRRWKTIETDNASCPPSTSSEPERELAGRSILSLAGLPGVEIAFTASVMTVKSSSPAPDRPKSPDSVPQDSQPRPRTAGRALASYHPLPNRFAIGGISVEIARANRSTAGSTRCGRRFSILAMALLRWALRQLYGNRRAAAGDCPGR
jgi:hypothetical protein